MCELSTNKNFDHGCLKIVFEIRAHTIRCADLYKVIYDTV